MSAGQDNNKYYYCNFKVKFISSMKIRRFLVTGISNSLVFIQCLKKNIPDGITFPTVNIHNAFLSSLFHLKDVLEK